MDLIKAQKCIQSAVRERHLAVIVGDCLVDYLGRATSKLPKGKRLILIKGDNSISVHRNKLVRPTNYMMNTQISTKLLDNTLVLTARRTKPIESLQIIFYGIDDVNAYHVDEKTDLRLSGSEKDLSNLLMQDLDFIEPGLKPLNQEQVLRKGIVDILAEDSKGRLVVIEVKRRQADYDSVTQLQRYMQQVKKIKNKETRGILIAPSIGKNARELLENLGLEFASIDFTLTPDQEQKAHIKGIQKKQFTLDKYVQ